MSRARSTSDGAADVELLCLDVDGVMTDGSINISDLGAETKRFHVRDGTAIRIWMELGYQVAIITGRRGMALRHRAHELGIEHVIQGSSDKLTAFNQMLKEMDLEPAAAAILADDLPDLPIMRRAGYPMAVADAVVEVRQAAKFITTRPGGHAAVREAIEHLLNAKKRWPDALNLFDKSRSAESLIPDP